MTIDEENHDLRLKKQLAEIKQDVADLKDRVKIMGRAATSTSVATRT